MRNAINIDHVEDKIIASHFDSKSELKTASIDWDKIDTGIVEHIRTHGRDGQRSENESGSQTGAKPGNDTAHAGGKMPEPMILGSYSALPPRGMLTLYTNNLSNYFWGILKILQHRSELPEAIPQEIIKNLAEFTVKATYCHEVFHYRCDVASILFGSRPPPLEEEALAVAFEFHHAGKTLQHDSPEQDIENLYNNFKTELFRFTAPGYRDWINYEKPEDFRAKLVEHVMHPNAVRLLRGAKGEIKGWFAGSLYMFMMDFPLDMLDEQELPGSTKVRPKREPRPIRGPRMDST